MSGGSKPAATAAAQQLLEDLRLGRLSATRLTEKASAGSVEAVHARAKGRLVQFKPISLEELFSGFAELGFVPGGIYIPADPELERQAREHLKELGEIEEEFARERAYREFQTECLQSEANGIEGDWTWQQAVARSRARFRVMSYGRRGGKTFYAAREAIVTARARRNATVWTTAPTDDGVERCWRMIVDLLKEKGWWNECPIKRDTADEKFIQLPNGSQIVGISLNSDLSAAGTAVDLAIIDEAEYIVENDWTRKVLPTLADKRGRALIISSNQDPDSFFNLRVERAKEQTARALAEGREPVWEVFEGNSWDNFFKFPQGRQSQAMREAEEEHDDPREFLAVYGAKPNSELDRVFYAFKERVHVGSAPFVPDGPPVTLVVDTSGGVNPYAVLAFQDYGPGAKVHVVDEFYATQVTAEMVCAELDDRPWRPFVQAVYIDQGNAPIEITRWQACGYPAMPIQVDDLSKPGYTKPGKPEIPESVPFVNDTFRNPIRFRAFQRAKLAAILVEWGVEDVKDLSLRDRQSVLIELEERLADSNLTEADIAVLRDCAGVLIDGEKCPNFIRECKTWRYQRTRADVDRNERRPMRKNDHTCDCFRYWCWMFRRHVWSDAQDLHNSLQVHSPQGRGFQGRNWLESLRLGAGVGNVTSLEPRSYLVSHR